MALIGSIENFNLDGDIWLEYIERVKKYFVANETTANEKKRGVLLTVMGSETYSLLRNLITPEKTAEKILDGIVKVLGTPIVIAERYRFYQRTQHEGESLHKYLAEVRKLTEFCEFGAFLGEDIRDKFVCGLNDISIRKRLLAEKELTLEKATSLALSFEKSAHESEQMVEERDQVHQIKDRKCYRCNEKGHLANRCIYKDFVCNHCTMRGHLEKACRKKLRESHTDQTKILHEKQNESTEPTDKLSEEPIKENEAYEDKIQYVYTIKANVRDAYQISLPVDNVTIEFEIDNGSARTIISENVYREKFIRFPLEKPDTLLCTYSCQRLQALGKICVDIVHNGTMCNVPLYVIKGDGPNLLGRDVLSKVKFDCSSVYKIKDKKMDDFKKQYSELFSEKLGKIKGYKAKLIVKRNAIPKFFKPRRIPFELENAVKLELKRLEADGVLISVKYADWASPIVVVPKPDGQVRIYGDFKRTVNPIVEAEQYSLPEAEELFQKMQGGKTFTKLDLKTAYLQMELDDETRKYLVINTPDGLKEFTRMPYGISSGPAIFQRKLLMELQHVPMTVVNIDGILISGKNEEEHLANSHEVCQKLLQLGVTLNTKTCKFFQDKVEYIGFILTKDGIQTNPEKVKAVLESPKPKDVKELQSFLGAINYYAKFICNMSDSAAPLFKLLCKDEPWVWGKKQEQCFNSLKRKLTETPLLGHCMTEHCLYS